MLLHASLVQPGLRPARPHDKPIARNVERAAEPIANEQWWAGRARAVRGVHREFSWDALNVTKDTECGGTKCYFPSSLQGERGDEGWLVGHSTHVGSLTQWSRAWALAEELRTHFGVDHLLRGPPFLVTLSHEQAMYLNAKIQARLDRQKHPKSHYPYRSLIPNGYNMTLVRYYAAGPHLVQAVHSCSWPECVVLRCTSPLTNQAIDGFVANVPNKTKLSLGMNQNFALVAAMVKARPCLKNDFQVYLRNDGAVLNIDLDRAHCEATIDDEDKLRKQRCFLIDGIFAASESDDGFREKRWVEIEELVEKISKRDLDGALKKWHATEAAVNTQSTLSQHPQEGAEAGR